MSDTGAATTTETELKPSAPLVPAEKSHHCGRPVRLGKKKPRHDHRTLRLARYLPSSLPPPPEACDWSTSAAPSWGLMLNDSLGDCTCAAIGHAIQAWTSANGQEITLTDNDILKAYEVFCGYVPGEESTDQGGIELDVLNGWRTVGVAGHVIKAYAALNPRDREEVKQAVFLFGGIYIGLALPLSAQNQEDWTIAESGELGDPTPGSWGGHAVFVVGYDATWVYFISWGRKMRMSWAFFIECCEEAYAVLSVDWADQDGAPCKLDLHQLEIDLAAVTNPATSNRPEVALKARTEAAARARRIAEGIVEFEDMDLDVVVRLSDQGGGEVIGKNPAGVELGVVFVPEGANGQPSIVSLRLTVNGNGQVVGFHGEQLEGFIRGLEHVVRNAPRRAPVLRDEGDDVVPPAPAAPPAAEMAPAAPPASPPADEVPPAPVETPAAADTPKTEDQA